MPERCENLEELCWTPGVPDCDLMMYLRAARSMAAFAGMCDGGSAEDGYLAASRDDTTVNALDLLHVNDYDTGKALQALVKNPIPLGIDKKWTEDEQKKFVKGLRQCGKNFFKIRKELLPHKETNDLVGFYYLWKKTPLATTSRPHRRHRRQSSLRRIRPSARQNRSIESHYNRPMLKKSTDDPSSVSEEEESDDSDSRDISSCHHCYTTVSKEWHHKGKSDTTLCTSCHISVMKTEEINPVAEIQQEPIVPFTFKSFKEEHINNPVNNNHTMQTRNCKEVLQHNKKSELPLNDNSCPHNIELQTSKSERKSPGAHSTCRASSTDKVDKEKKKTEISEKKKQNGEVYTYQPEDDERNSTRECNKKKRVPGDRSSSPSESVTTESSSVSNEENGNEGDNEGGDVPSSSSSPSISISPPVPLPNDSLTDNERSERMEQQAVNLLETEEKFVQPIPDAEVSHSLTTLIKVEHDISQTDEFALSVSSSIDEALCIPVAPRVKIKEEVPSFLHDIENHSEAYPNKLSLETENIDQLQTHQGKQTLLYPQLIHSPSIDVHHDLPGPSPHNIKLEPIDPSNPLEASSPEDVHKSDCNLDSTSSVCLPPIVANPLPVNINPPSITAVTYTSNHPVPATSVSLTVHNKNKLSPPINSIGITSQGLTQSTPPFSYAPYYPSHLFSPGSIPSHLAYPPQQPLLTSNRSSPVKPKQPSTSPSLSSPNHHTCLSFLPQSGTTSGSITIPHTIPQMHASNSLPISQNSASVSTDLFSPSAESNQEKGNSVTASQEIAVKDDDRELQSSRIDPSPEPKMENVECHRSQSAIFLRHWNRGCYNSCARTDLTFKPVPDSKLARKREQARKVAEREREEKKFPSSKGLGSDGKFSSHILDISHLNSYERNAPRVYSDTPALRQLSEYARPHAGFSPNYHRPSVNSSNMSLGMSSHGMDPLLQYQLASGLCGAPARERLEMEMEREKRERDFQDKLKVEMELKSRLSTGASHASTVDPHWLEIHRRYGASQNGIGPPVVTAGSSNIPSSPFSIYHQSGERERIAIATSLAGTDVERYTAERMAFSNDPLLRFQVSALPSDLHPHAHTHAHTHAHAHTHLHLHPHDPVAAATAAAMAMPTHPHMDASLNPNSVPHHLIPSGNFPSSARHALVPRPEMLHPPHAMMRSHYEDAFTHQISSQVVHHEQLQRHLMLERERYVQIGAQMLHPQLLPQHEEFIRQQQQRERELKLRALEEAARGRRPPLN